MGDTDMAEAPEEAEAMEPLQFDVLQFVRTAQSQHGLRHNDFTRYRQYCTNKLQRSRKHLKLQQGRGKFVRKPLELSAVVSIAHLQLPLVNAEQSWAHAMESKTELDGEHAGKARQNMLRRLAKASKYASEFANFASQRGSTRTSLEAEGYAAHMAGLSLLEHPNRRKEALLKLQRAQRICEELSKTGSFEQQAAAQQRLDEIEPVARFAQYQLSQGKPGRDSAVPQTPTTPNIGAKFSALYDEQPDAAKSSKTQAGGAVYLQWRGGSHPAFAERLKGHLSQAADLEKQLSQSEGLEAQLSVLEKLAGTLSEAKGIVRHTLATSSGAGADSADALEDMKALNTAVSGKQLEFTIQKNKLLARQAEQRLDTNSQPAAAIQTSTKKDKKLRGQGPMSVVRLYDTLLQNVKDLSEIASQLGGAAGEYLLDDCTAMAAEMRAKRCFFVARTYLADLKPQEAHALFGRAQERSAEAVSAHEDCAKPDTSALKVLEELKVVSGAWKVVSHAKVLEAGEQVAAGVNNIQLSSANQTDIPVKYLVDDLESWKSYAGDESSPPRLAPIPPRLQQIQVRPFLLDCALEYIQPPDLSHRIPKEEKKSTIGRLFGWGASK